MIIFNHLIKSKKLTSDMVRNKLTVCRWATLDLNGYNLYCSSLVIKGKIIDSEIISTVDSDKIIFRRSKNSNIGAGGGAGINCSNANARNGSPGFGGLVTSESSSVFVIRKK